MEDEMKAKQPKQAQAWCWASGLIEIGEQMPADKADGSGAILIAKGPMDELEAVLSVVARHGKGASAGKLLVPGVPEAKSGNKKVDVLIAWLTWCKASRRVDRLGVVFS
jgi:hypothetical protein